MDVVIKAVQMGTVKTSVVIAGDQYLVPVGKVADPLKEIKRLCLGALHREVPTVHEVVRLREVPQAAALLMLPPLLRKPDIREHRPDLVQGILHQEGELIVPVIVGNGAGDMDFLL